MAKKQIETKQLEEKLVSLESQFKRAVADYHNLEKRVHTDSSAIACYLRDSLVIKILPVLDSLDQAVEGAGQSEAEVGWLKGVLMSIKQLRQVLSEEGLVEIDTSGSFDPRFHEAVDVREGRDGTILEITQRGYTLGDKVVRPAKVVVGKSQPESLSEEAKKEVQAEES